MKLSDMFDPISLHTSYKIVVKHISVKETLSKLDLENKCRGHSKNQKTITCQTKNAEQGLRGKWCATAMSNML